MDRLKPSTRTGLSNSVWLRLIESILNLWDQELKNLTFESKKMVDISENCQKIQEPKWENSAQNGGTAH